MESQGLDVKQNDFPILKEPKGLREAVETLTGKPVEPPAPKFNSRLWKLKGEKRKSGMIKKAEKLEAQSKLKAEKRMSKS